MKNEIKYFSMFSGVGGFEQGFNRANNARRSPKKYSKNDRLQPNTNNRYGPWRRSYSFDCKTAPQINSRNKQSKQFKCIGFSEIDKYASQVLKYQFPKVKNWGDCTKINPAKLPDFDLLCGGFPCQTFSIAGKRQGFEDTRGTMFFEIARIAKAKRPEIILLENVKGLLSHEKGKTYRLILQTLAELGYDIGWLVLNSKFFGVPQNRQRIFIIASLRGKSRPEILPFKKSNAANNEMEQQVCATIHSGYYKQGRDQQYIPEFQPVPETKGNSQGSRVYKTKGISQALTSNGGGLGAKTGLYLDKMKIRRLTPKECERLQGFPDNWTTNGIDKDGNPTKLSDTQRYKQMGNAVTTNVIEAIANKLSNHFSPKSCE